MQDPLGAGILQALLKKMVNNDGAHIKKKKTLPGGCCLFFFPPLHNADELLCLGPLVFFKRE